MRSSHRNFVVKVAHRPRTGWLALSQVINHKTKRTTLDEPGFFHELIIMYQHGGFFFAKGPRAKILARPCSGQLQVTAKLTKPCRHACTLHTDAVSPCLLPLTSCAAVHSVCDCAAHVTALQSQVTMHRGNGAKPKMNCNSAADSPTGS